MPPVTEAELAVLERLWDAAPQSARQLASQLYPRQTPSDIATVQKLVQRLEGKELVIRDRGERVHEFRPALSRETYAGNRLAELADRLTEGSVAPLLLHLVNSRKLTARELAELREILDQGTPTRKGRS